ncbi:MAG: 1-acyl-sn-glycerol-3-phosphate acyltransferase [Maribacter sp.]|nr:1-acyl-sn-glycerol-3-phosphate acyltransferase [Maribacter sp.]
MRNLAKILYFNVLGWKFVGTFPKLDQCVIIIAPHTSWVDFFLGLLVREVMNIHINYIGKKSLFDPPFGWFFKWMGGAPIDRSKSSNTVNATAKLFSQRKEFRLALSPEGTRKKVLHWKTGFYFIAKAAKVPIVMVAFDYGTKQVKISEPHFTTDDQQADFKIYKDFFNGVKGKIPELG